ncbi:THOC6 [Bugula neritina]|uniref:THOC6 n=1 Tax=Bugula neritina TaxID=10212 RepID=A0A7J7JKQ1_BUGNE|nr:THOC6 [Bugula neritina]
MPPTDKSGLEMRQSRTPLERLHTTVFGQSFSRCGNFLAVCDNLGYVTVYRLSDALSSNSRKTNLHPHYYFKASDYSIYSIITHDDFLICGGENMISGWLWSDIISKSAKISWSLKIPSSGSDLTEANSLEVCKEI